MTMTTGPLIRVGAPVWSLARHAGLCYPWLVSANALYDHKNGEFRQHKPVDPAAAGTALDSAGFVAMRRYGGYPWAMSQYASLGALESWDWWAAMDYCCEPEIATDRAEVRRRVERTAESLGDLRAHVDDLRHEGASWATMPMPVIQGWAPEDYRLSARLTGEALGGHWPALVGVGSVCRRRLRGRDGVLSVVGAVAAAVPPSTGMHLFGVKSGALAALHDHPQVASVDSCAYDMAARWDACKTGASNTMAHRVEHMRAWVASQREMIAAARAASRRQPSLLPEPAP